MGFMELVFLIHVYDHHDEKTEQTLLQQVVHTQRPVRDKKGGPRPSSLSLMLRNQI